MLEYYDNNIYGIYSSPQVSTCTLDWQASLAEELATVHNPVLPLTKVIGSQFKKDSAKLLSQLSQLSFKELEDISLNLDVAPAKPPPPRPAPPGRPPAPPGRPSAPPRPGPPPSRPEPPKPKPQCLEENDAPLPSDKPNQGEPQPTAEVPKTGGGFSDLFSAPPDPDIASDIPISLSIESLVSFTASGEATPAPTKPPLPIGGSIDVEYPINYEPHLSPPPSESPTSPESPEHKKLAPVVLRRNISNNSSTETESGNSTPTNKERAEPPSVPSRLPPRELTDGPPSGPPPGPPPAGPPHSPPPRVPSRPAGGPPPQIPRR